MLSVRNAGLYVDGKYKYSGEWNMDKMQGLGKFIYASGTTYNGQWDNSEYHGTGTFSWPDGRQYEVEFSDHSCARTLNCMIGLIVLVTLS